MLTPSVRLSSLAARLTPEVDALLVTDLVNVRYLTGFTGSNAALLVLRDEPAVFATDGRYLTQASEEVTGLQVLETRQLALDLARWASSHSIGRLGIEAEHLSLSTADLLRHDGEGPGLIHTEGLVEAMRVVKADDEVAALRIACAITDAAFGSVVDLLRPGVTERDLAWSLATVMRENGAEALAFDSIVAFGPHSAVPHHQPTDRPLAHGDLVKLDFGARYAGYHADMTRTLVVGTPHEWQIELHAAVSTVQQNCRDAIVPGAMPQRLGELARDQIEAAGHAPVHGLGHGVGLQVHEQPWLSPASSSEPLAEAMCLTVEPGIYLPGRGGVRIEDTVLVTATGNETLTASPRELLEV